MGKHKFCPIIKGNCMKSDCTLWVKDYTKVTNLKTHKSGIKDTSNCAFEKMGEQAVIKIWEDTERLINQTDEKSDPYEHCLRNPLDNCPHVDDGITCPNCEFYKE